MSEQTENPSPAVPTKKAIGKGALIGGVVVVVCIAIGGGVAFRNAKAHAAAVAHSPDEASGPNTAELAPEAGKREASPAEEGGEEAESTLVNLAPFVVNLEDDSGEMHYLKVQITVQLAAASYNKAFTAHTPKVRNALLFYLSSLKVADTQGIDNKKKILERLRTEVREAVSKAAIADVYLTEFVIQ